MGMIYYKFYRSAPTKANVSVYKSNWSVKGFKEGFAETNEIHIAISPNTKTSLRIRMSSGSAEHDDVLEIARESKNFKTLEKVIHNPFGGPDTVKHFFKVSKKQGMTELEHYIMEALRDMDLLFFDTTIHFYFLKMETMKIDITEGLTNIQDK